MPYHVYLYQYDNSARTGAGDSYVFANLSKENLQTRVIDPWDKGDQVFWDGHTVDTLRSKIQIFSTEGPLAATTRNARVGEMRQGLDLTNSLIEGPAGHKRLASVGAGGSPELGPLAVRDASRVMVVHGRNTNARNAMFTFLRACGVTPIEWDDAISETGVATPHNFEAVRAAMDVAQAVVVVLTAEDQAGLLPDLASPGDDDVSLRGQPRQNVILEAGLAMGVDRRRTILVELGEIRRASDFDGLNVVRITNAAPTRQSLRRRLEDAGCSLNTGSDWMSAATGGDFEAAVIDWTPTPLP